MQAQNVLQNMYTGQIRGQLEYKEEKEAAKKSKRLNADGRAKLLTSEEFKDLVEEAADKRAAEEAAVAQKKDARVTANQRLATAMVRWEVQKQSVEEQNTQRTEAEANLDQAYQAHLRFRNPTQTPS